MATVSWTKNGKEILKHIEGLGVTLCGLIFQVVEKNGVSSGNLNASEVLKQKRKTKSNFKNKNSFHQNLFSFCLNFRCS